MEASIRSITDIEWGFVRSLSTCSGVRLHPAVPSARAGGLGPSVQEYAPLARAEHHQHEQQRQDRIVDEVHNLHNNHKPRQLERICDGTNFGEVFCSEIHARTDGAGTDSRKRLVLAEKRV